MLNMNTYLQFQFEIHMINGSRSHTTCLSYTSSSIKYNTILNYSLSFDNKLSNTIPKPLRVTLVITPEVSVSETFDYTIFRSSSI